ncbi:hypothetical protein Q5752_003785 [Cryptotrichosporon argae]
MGTIGTTLRAPIEGEPDSPRVPGGYQLARPLSGLVETPEKHAEDIRYEIVRLQDTLPQLCADSLRSARAHIVFLRSVLDGEGQAVATARAGGVYAADA